MTEVRDVVALGPGEGVRVATAGTGGAAIGSALVKATADDTHGGYALHQSYAPAGQPAAHLHVHHATEEAFIVLEGELTFHVEGRKVAMGAGSFVLVPRGVRHTFANPGGQPARYLVLFSPAGLERFFEELAALRSASSDGRVDAATLVELAAKYDTEYFGLPPRV